MNRSVRMLSIIRLYRSQIRGDVTLYVRVKEYLLMVLKMKLVRVSPQVQLYHGSTRLYQINCYIRRQRRLLQQYFQQELSTDISRLDPYFYQDLQSLYQVYTHTLYVDNPISKEVLYVATVELVTLNTTTPVSVYQVWRQFLPEDDPDREMLLQYAQELEDQHPREIDVMFYSTMRLPIQYFTTSYRNAVRYASRNPELSGAVYTYTLTQEVILLDYDDLATIDELAETVFASHDPFSLTEIKYQLGMDDLASVRYEIMIQSLTYHVRSVDTLLSILDQVCLAHDTIGLWRLISVPDLLERLAWDWHQHFQEELMTPYALWRFTTWPSAYRITLYESDALLAKVLLEDGRYDGYISNRSAELAILHPERWGTMDTAEVWTDPERCPYQH